MKIYKLLVLVFLLLPSAFGYADTIDVGCKTSITTNGLMEVTFSHQKLADGRIEVIIKYEGVEKRVRVQDGEEVQFKLSRGTNLVEGGLLLEMERKVVMFDGTIHVTNIAAVRLRSVVACF